MMYYDYKRLRVDTAIHGDSSTAPGRHTIRACLRNRRGLLGNVAMEQKGESVARFG
jgi:hypothetical protein